MNHWRRKAERTECTVGFKSIGDVISKDESGALTNLAIAGVHFSKWASYIGASAVEIERQVKNAEKEFNAVQALCESPIERRLLPWLIYEDYGIGPQAARCYNWKEEVKPFRAPVLIIPQFAILRFRVDFMIIARRKDGSSIMVPVECDGFDFHTATRDQQRDGHLAMMGLRTVRSSGAEISNNPRGVSAQVAAIVMEATQ